MPKNQENSSTQTAYTSADLAQKQPQKTPSTNDSSATAATVCVVAGGSGSGKTTLARALKKNLGNACTHFLIDWYYRDQSHLTPEKRAEINYDHPDSLEVELFVEHLKALRAGQSIQAPIYDFASHTRLASVNEVHPAPIVLCEGIHLLAIQDVVDIADSTVFVSADNETRLQRRIERDIRERGRTEQSVRSQWFTTVLPMHEHFVEPSRVHANTVILSDENMMGWAEVLASQLRAASDL